MGAKPSRQYYLDWLRLVAVLGVFIFHTLRFFDPISLELENWLMGELVKILIWLIAQWMMPLFFTIAGASIFYSLSTIAPGEFLRARFWRLLFPLLTVGTLVLVPPQEYIKALREGWLAGTSFFEFYPKIFTHNPLLTTTFPWFGLPMMHLWFLWALFIFSAAMLPLFICLKSEKGAIIASKLRKAFERPWMPFLLILPIGVVTSLLNPALPLGVTDNYGGWAWPVYLIFLLYGYLFFADRGFMKALQRQGRVALLLAVLTSAPVFLIFREYSPTLGSAFGTPFFYLLMLLRAINAWCWLVAFFGLGQEYLQSTNHVLSYANEGIIAFYMLHQTVIYATGFLIMDWAIAALPRYITLTIISFAAILGIYEIFIRRFNLVRLFFGMKRK